MRNGTGRHSTNAPHVVRMAGMGVALALLIMATSGCSKQDTPKQAVATDGPKVAASQTTQEPERAASPRSGTREALPEDPATQREDEKGVTNVEADLGAAEIKAGDEAADAPGEKDVRQDRASKDEAAARTGVSKQAAQPEQEEVKLPEQVTRRLTEADVPTVLEQAIQTKDVVLVDRIAWQTKNKEAEKKAEDFLAEIRQAFLRKFQREVKDGSATLPAGGIAVGEAASGYSGSASSFFKKLEAKHLPDGFHVVFGKWSVTRSSFDVTYGVVVDGSVRPGGYELGFIVRLYDARDKDKENPESMGAAAVKLKLRVTEGTVSADEVYALYSVAMWHSRRYREYGGEAIRLAKSAIGLLGGESHGGTA